MIQFKKPRRWVSKVFIHCSAADTYLRGKKFYDWVWRIHVGGQPHRWSDIGYHFMIDKYGTVIKGRPLEKIPAANRNNKRVPGFGTGNAGTIAICLDGLREDKFTHAQSEALTQLCGRINDAYDGKVTFHAHNEVAWKECPVFDIYDVLPLKKGGKWIE